EPVDAIDGATVASCTRTAPCRETGTGDLRSDVRSVGSLGHDVPAELAQPVAYEPPVVTYLGNMRDLLAATGSNPLCQLDQCSGAPGTCESSGCRGCPACGF